MDVWREISGREVEEGYAGGMVVDYKGGER